MLNNESVYAKQIEEKGFVVATPVGISMLPLLRQGIDTVKLVKPTLPLKKFDVILYKRPDGKYVLHRILKIKKNEYYLCGDNQLFIEKGVKESWIIAIMDGFYRGDEYIDVTNKKYLKYVKKRTSTRWFRKLKYIIKRVLVKIFKR